MHNSTFRRRAFLSFTACLVFLAACAPFTTENLKFTPTVAAPAATGTIHLSTDAGANTIVSLTVQNLPVPNTLTPPASVYMVWEQVADAIVKRGPLQGNAIKFTASGRDFYLFITAEQSSGVEQPAGPTVLQTTVSW